MHSSASSTSGMGRHICIDSINHHPLQQWHSKMLQNQQSSYLHDNLPHRHDVQLVQEGSDAMRLRYSWDFSASPLVCESSRAFCKYLQWPLKFFSSLVDVFECFGILQAACNFLSASAQFSSAKATPSNSAGRDYASRFPTFWSFESPSVEYICAVCNLKE